MLFYCTNDLGIFFSHNILITTFVSMFVLTFVKRLFQRLLKVAESRMMNVCLYPIASGGGGGRFIEVFCCTFFRLQLMV